jgi:predicted TIM-barrel fold metal-dependent hydrolase
MVRRFRTPGAEPTNSAAIRSKLGHPVIDADGHAIEFGPVFFEFLKQAGGQSLLERYRKRLDEGGWFRLSPDERIDRRVFRPTSWTIPAENTLDRATAMLPRLFRSRMDDFGLDFAIVYPTLALALMGDADDDIRRGSCRALNMMFAELFSGQADRMTPVATIPAHTPQEAIEELEFAVKTLGFKAAMISSAIKRPVPIVARQTPDAARHATWVDTLCMDSPYDYDPLWAKCVELKIAVTAHTPSRGTGGRVTTTSYIYNHVGSFAAAGEAFAKAVVLGGVAKRFPTLNFAFLEGGVTWAAELYGGLVGHCGKRNSTAIKHYDPHRVDTALMAELFAEYGKDMFPAGSEHEDAMFVRTPNGWHWLEDRDVAHELDRSGIESAEDLRPLFENNFYFGCEADDPYVALAFDRRLNPFGARLKAMFSSDIGHWDVPDMNEVLAEAYELVEHGLLNDDEFNDFVFKYPAMLHAGMNPDFFKGTVVEADVDKLLSTL